MYDYEDHPREDYYDREDHPHTRAGRHDGSRTGDRTVAGSPVKKARRKRPSFRGTARRTGAS